MKQLPNNSFINRLLDDGSLKRKAEGEEEAKCDQCTRSDPVRAVCLDCGEFLCNHCLEHHKYSKEYQNHNTMSLNEVQSKKKGTTIKPKPKTYKNYATIDKPSKIINCKEGGRMGSPWGIAFGKHGEWAVTDESNNCVWIFDGKDELVRKFGSYGTGNGRFNNPIDVAFDANNHLYVSDHNNHRVQKFDILCTYLLQFGSQGSLVFSNMYCSP